MEATGNQLKFYNSDSVVKQLIEKEMLQKYEDSRERKWMKMQGERMIEPFPDSLVKVVDGK